MRIMRTKTTKKIPRRVRVKGEKSLPMKAVPTVTPIEMKPPIKNSTTTNKKRPLRGSFTRLRTPSCA
jgi:hypothetical protein